MDEMSVGSMKMIVTEVSDFITTLRLFEMTEANESIVPVRMFVWMEDISRAWRYSMATSSRKSRSSSLMPSWRMWPRRLTTISSEVSDVVK